MTPDAAAPRRAALVTGGASGLGLATATRLAAEGLAVVVADLREAAARQAAATLPGSGHLGLGVDVADEASVLALFDAAEAAVGPLAVLVCFAGILNTPRPAPAGAPAAPGRTPLAELSLDEWERVHAVNARGTFLCLREMTRRRIARPVPHGRIVTVSSLAGQQGGLQAGAAYSASKGAVLALTKVCARELAAQGVTVNAIAPGPIDTPMMRASVPEGHTGANYPGLANIPLGRVGQPQEIAAAVAYLVSIDAGYVTGATLDVNGGMRMG